MSETIIIEESDITVIVSDSWEQSISGGISLQSGDLLDGGNAFTENYQWNIQ